MKKAIRNLKLNDKFTVDDDQVFTVTSFDMGCLFATTDTNGYEAYWDLMCNGDEVVTMAVTD